MGTKKRECLFRLYGYVKKRANECWLSIFNGVHIHKMESKLEGHLLASRLTDKDKKIVVDLTKSLVKSEHILMNLKGKQKDNSMNFRYFHLVLFFIHKMTITREINKKKTSIRLVNITIQQPIH
jgi:hypothetical protein